MTCVSTGTERMLRDTTGWIDFSRIEAADMTYASADAEEPIIDEETIRSWLLDEVFANSGDGWSDAMESWAIFFDAPADAEAHRTLVARDLVTLARLAERHHAETGGEIAFAGRAYGDAKDGPPALYALLVSAPDSAALLRILDRVRETDPRLLGRPERRVRDRRR